MNVPPRILLRGDRYAAATLVRQASIELDRLLHSMRQAPIYQPDGYGPLHQATRRVYDNHGNVIEVSVHGLDRQIVIFSPPVTAEEEEKIVIRAGKLCWCTCCFSDAKILAVLGDYNHVGSYGKDELYPAICNASDIAVWNYNGIRYQVEVCTKINDYTSTYNKFIAIPTDFYEYQPEDKVIVVFRGRWEGDELNPNLVPGDCHDCLGAACTGGGCEGNWPPGREFTDEWRYADGTFVVSPIEVAGIT